MRLKRKTFYDWKVCLQIDSGFCLMESEICSGEINDENIIRGFIALKYPKYNILHLECNSYELGGPITKREN